MSLPCVSGGKPLLEKRRRFRPFHPPPYGIHDSTADRTTALIETKPIRQVELAGDSGDLYPRITQLEEPLLKITRKTLSRSSPAARSSLNAAPSRLRLGRVRSSPSPGICGNSNKSKEPSTASMANRRGGMAVHLTQNRK